MSNMLTKAFGVLLVAALVVFALLTTLSLPAQAQGPPPHIVIGTAQANGSPVAAGSTVTAWGGDEQIGSATTEADGNFTMQVNRTSGIIHFKINGVFANETIHQWEQGGYTGSGSERFILTTGEADPDAPTPSPNPTPTPSPTPQWGRVIATPSTVLPNQRITLTGTGFAPGSQLTSGSISGPGRISYFYPRDDVLYKLNGGEAVEVDNSGQWSAVLDIPLLNVFPGYEIHKISIHDSGGRRGAVNVTVPGRVVTIDPATGRIGTTAMVRGQNFPVKNDNGASFNISIAYDTGVGRPTTVTTVSDASGRFGTGIVIPSNATIPSANTVRVSYIDELNYEAVTTVTHQVPPAAIALSATSGAPGSTISLRGEGFMSFVPVTGAWVSSIDVLPSPAPATDAQGNMDFDIRIPDLAPGVHYVSVRGIDAEAGIQFTVISAPPPTATPYPTPTPTPAPTATPYPTPAPTSAPPQLPGGNEPPHIFTGTATLNGSPAGQGIAVDAYDGGRLVGATVTQANGKFTIHVHRSAGVITFRVNQQAAAESWTTWQQGQVTTGFNLTVAAGSSESDPSRLFAALPDLVRAFSFDNATKQWDFFDPVAAEVSTLTRFMPGNIYWLLVSHTTRLMLNGAERDLSCVGDDCWNLIVW